MKKFYNILKEMDHQIIEYPKGKMIFSKNELCTSFALILSGTVQIQKITPDGNVLIIAEFNTGDSIGESLVFGSNKRFPMSVFAKEKTSILYVSKENILYMCQKDLNFLSNLLEFLSNKSLILSSKINEVSLKTINEKICEFVLNEYYIQDNLKIKLNISKTEMANQMGILRTSLYRELNNLKSKKILNYDRNYIYILNIDKLKNNYQYNI